MGCIFCDIIAKKIPSEVFFEDDMCIAIADINPEAPVHMLVMPKAHIESALDINRANSNEVGHIYAVIAHVMKKQGISSYRVVTNCGADAGQTVGHLHFHVLAGRKLAWPPG